MNTFCSVYSVYRINIFFRYCAGGQNSGRVPWQLIFLSHAHVTSLYLIPRPPFRRVPWTLTFLNHAHTRSGLSWPTRQMDGFLKNGPLCTMLGLWKEVCWIDGRDVKGQPLFQAWPDLLKTYRIVTPFPSGSSFTIESPVRIILIITSQQSAVL